MINQLTAKKWRKCYQSDIAKEQIEKKYSINTKQDKKKLKNSKENFIEKSPSNLCSVFILIVFLAKFIVSISQNC